MRMADILDRKRNGETLTRQEIEYFVNGYTKAQIPDYQASALLMAICIRGMTDAETADLTDCMARSGAQMDLSAIDGITADKHSTGGVGDKTTLVVVPVCAAAGLKMAKMSGRGLGHTGGTIDKLESIPGFRTDLSMEAFFEQVNRIGLAITGQTAELAPADQKLYALRDASGTVSSADCLQYYVQKTRRRRAKHRIGRKMRQRRADAFGIGRAAFGKTNGGDRQTLRPKRHGGHHRYGRAFGNAYRQRPGGHGGLRGFKGAGRPRSAHPLPDFERAPDCHEPAKIAGRSFCDRRTGAHERRGVPKVVGNGRLSGRGRRCVGAGILLLTGEMHQNGLLPAKRVYRAYARKARRGVRVAAGRGSGDESGSHRPRGRPDLNQKDRRAHRARRTACHAFRGRRRSTAGGRSTVFGVPDVLPAAARKAAADFRYDFLKTNARPFVGYP